MDESHRLRLTQLAADRGASLASLSRMIGRNAAYLQQYVERGSPRRLGEDDRLALAQHFMVDERELGAREPWAPR
jgi:transposase-like protein